MGDRLSDNSEIMTGCIDKKVSLIVPCYNEHAALPFFYEQVKAIIDGLSQYTWELLFVNDGSSDNTLDIIRQLRTQDNRVCYVDLSRNFGKENAMLAGFDYATGDCAIIIDADLQDPPSLIYEMLVLWEQGYQDVYAKRKNRAKESWLRRRLTLAYYALLQHASRIDILQNVGDFRLLDRKCIDALRQIRESERYTKGMFCWIGYRKKEIVFDRSDRITGESSFNFLKLFELAVEGISSFSTAPLRLSTLLGFIISILTMFYICYFLLKTIIFGEPVRGFPTLVIIILFLGGIQLLSLGIIGEYLGRIFQETKNRPVYLVNEYVGL